MAKNTFEIYQEAAPFTNKRFDRNASSNRSFDNPILLPFAFDFTTNVNTLECVIYIRNSSQEKRYEYVVLSLMKEGTNKPLEDPYNIANIAEAAAITRNGDILSYEVNNKSVVAGFSTESWPSEFQTNATRLLISSLSENNGYYNFYEPVDNDDLLTCKLSYGYDELTEVEWKNKGSVLIIPNIGTTSQFDTSYHPVRLRTEWKTRSTFTTIRDYFLDISYITQEDID